MEYDDSLKITLQPPRATFVRELAEIVGISPDELAQAAVAHIVDLPIPAAVGICQSYLDINDADDDTDSIDDIAALPHGEGKAVSLSLWKRLQNKEKIT
jgi:hypothetical protein